MKERFSVKHIAVSALLLAAAIILSYVESLIPWNFSVPGIKLGLANIAIVFALYRLGNVEGAVISLLRVIIMALLFGTFLSFIYAVSGAVLSYAVMLLLKKLRFSVPTVSIVGAVSHNIAQIIAAAVILTFKEIIFYLPVLLVAGILAGAVIGILSTVLVKRIPKKLV